MGGNVFKHEYEVLRLEKNEYFKYVNEVMSLLSQFYTNKELHVTQAIRSKEDFGDMDVIVKGSSKRVEVENFLTSSKYPFVKNGDVTSFLYKSFQIDLIFTNEDHYEYSCNYFDWNDLGNLVGRISKQLGFKHGHDGLYYVLRNDDRIIKEFLLSTSYLDIIHILGLDKLKFKQGFDSYEDLFEFILASPYFNPEIFKLENLNNINRVRDRKRKTYNLFLKYIEDKDYNKLDGFQRKLTYEEKEKFVFRRFSKIYPEVRKLTLQVELENKIKEKINGRIIMQLAPSAKGERVGEYIKAIKDRRPDLYSKEVLDMTQEEIHLGILTAILEHNKEVRPYVHD